jgi:hypothetical protein
MNAKPPVRIGVIGDANIDASGELLGAAKLASLIQSLGAQAALAALVPDNQRGEAIKANVHDQGVDVSRVEPSSKPSLTMGDRIDVAGLFDMDAVLVAVSDPRLHRFLVDLPVHTAPNARLIGLLANLAQTSKTDAWETVLRHDAVIAATAQLASVTGVSEKASALDAIQRAMVGNNLRVAAIRDDDGAAWIIEKTERWAGETGSFDRFAAAMTVVFAARRPWCDAFALAEAL